MGGEDLDMWVDMLIDEDLLASEVKVVAYTYIGSELTWAYLPRWNNWKGKR